MNKMRLDLKKVAALGSLLIVVLAWTGGSLRAKDAAVSRLEHISENIIDLRKVDDSLYEGRKKDDPESPVYIAVESVPSYGGPLTAAVVVNENKQVELTAVLESTDTSTYLEKVAGSGVLDAFIGAFIDKMPDVDAVSGATISSTAVIQGLERAVAYIGARKFGLEEKAVERTMPGREWIKLISVAALFLAVLAISSRRFPWNKKRARAGLMILSVIILGFTFSSQFSLSTLAVLLGGGWLKGLATYGPLLCLLLALIVFFMTKKNLYCASLCPFGAVQEGLGRITGCSPPPRSRWMVGASRAFALAALAAALYFRDSSAAIYEPFGMAFNFIGSTALYALTILIVISSLVFKRPWCLLFCPIGAIFDYLQFMRNWVRNAVKRPAGKGGEA